MTPLLLMLLTFGAVAAAVAAAYSLLTDLYLRDRATVGRRIDEAFRNKQRERARESLLFKDLHRLAIDTAEAEPRLGPRRRLASLIEQSGLDLSVGRFGALTFATGLIGIAALGLPRQSPSLGAIGGLLGAAIPIAYLRVRRNARQQHLCRQLPDAFDLMARITRAGQTVHQSMHAVVDEFTPPLAVEFSFCYEQQNLGLSPELALRDLARRTGLLEVKIFVTALLVQQQTGGNLAELLDKTADIMRQRQRLRGKIESLTAEGRMQAIVLLSLPILMFFIMLAINRDYMAVLFQHRILIGVTLACEVLGAITIRKIVNFDF